jgi:anti-sigma B factor antagonist
MPDTDVSPGPHFDVQATHVGSAVVLAVRGDLDALTAPNLAEAVRVALVDRPATLIIDLSELEFLASAGMSVLVGAHEAAGTTTRFGVVANGNSTSRPLKTVGLDTVFDLYSTLDAALTQ